MRRAASSVSSCCPLTHVKSYVVIFDNSLSKVSLLDAFTHLWYESGRELRVEVEPDREVNHGPFGANRPRLRRGDFCHQNAVQIFFTNSRPPAPVRGGEHPIDAYRDETWTAHISQSSHGRKVNP